MSKKVEINLIYGPHKKSPVVHYEDENGIVWLSNRRDGKKHNITMSWYYLRNPQPDDSALVIEPRCVHEPDYRVEYLKRFKYIFTWASKAITSHSIKQKVIEINHPSCKFPPSKDAIAQNWSKPWNQRKNEIVFIASRKSSKHISEIYTLRTMLADMFHRHKDWNVSWYGQIPMKKPYYKGSVPNKMSILKDAKFTICTENCYHQQFSHNYFTEKLPEAWFGGACPLYIGCYNINDLGFAPNSYIDLRQFVQKNGKNIKVNWHALTKVMNEFNGQKYEAMKTSVLENLEKPDGLFHVISYDRMYRKMIEAYS